MFALYRIIRDKDKIFSIALPLVFFILSCVPMMIGISLQGVPLLIVHIAMAAICVYGIFSDRSRPYTQYKVLNLFFLFFFCIAPIAQYNQGVCLLGTVFLFGDYMLTSVTSLAVLIITHIVYYLSKQYFDKKHSQKLISQPSINDVSIGLRRESILVAISLLLAIYFLYINQFNVLSLVSRDGDFVDRLPQSQTVYLISEYFLRPISIVILLSTLMLKVKHPWIRPILLILLVITVPPTGVPRVLTAVVYIPLVLYLIPLFRRGWNFVALICVGVLLIFPFLNMFRKVHCNTFGIVSQFLDLNFDAYSMLMRVLKEDIVTGGTQLLGALLFWVPRSLWPTKPVSSGHYVADQTGLNWNDLSMPFWGEGYINFGYFGVIIFTIVLSVVLAKLDSKYWCITSKRSRDLDSIKYFLLLSLLIFILRGSMISAVAYTCGIMVSFYFVKTVVLYENTSN